MGLTTLTRVKPLVGKFTPFLTALGLGLVAALTIAQFPTGNEIPIVLVLVFAALALAALVALVWQVHRSNRNADLAVELQAEIGRLETLLTTVPMPWCGWSPDGARSCSPEFAMMLGGSECERLEDIENLLMPSDAAALHGAFSHLRRTGQGFHIQVTTSDGARILELTGSRGAGRHGHDPFDVLWARDITAATADLRQAGETRTTAMTEAAEMRAALNVVPLPVWLRHPDLSIAWCNSAYAKALETTPEAVVESQRDLSSGIIGGSGRELAGQALSSGIAQSETLHLVIGGSRRLIEVTEAPLPPGEPTQGMIVGYALDLTRQEELQNELARHISAHAEVLEQLGLPIAIFGPDQRLKFFNQAYIRLWGVEENRLDGEPTYAEILEDLRSRRRLPEYADFPRFKREQLGKFTSLLEPAEDLLHLPDGTTLRMLIVPHPFGGLMFIYEDVTNALALESSYNTLMAVQQESLDNLAEGIAVFGGDGRLKLSNPAYARIWNLRSDDLMGEPHVVELIEKMKSFFDYGDDWQGFKEDTIGNTLDRTPRSGRIERSDGSVIEFANVPLPDGAVLNSFLDVTDSVRVEQALRERNAALETADRLKAEFIANVSYQLRTPLNAIMGFAEILVNRYFGELNERQLDYCRAILESGQRLLLLINDILDLATVEAGFMVLERSAVDIRALLDSVVDLTREWARKQQLELEISCPADIGTVEADEKRLKQALFNLISNAIKFTPPGGRIVLSAQRTDDAVALCVSDTGIGIPPADQERVFGRFERTNPQARQAGAGLGLSLVKSFVELHGGHVDIESRVNKGTRIRCTLSGKPQGKPALIGNARTNPVN
jgi:signal transduction histidine kinase